MSKSQSMTLIEAFKRGEKLTVLEAFYKYKIATFSQRLNDVERMGYTIARCWITPSSGKKYMLYWLQKIDLQSE